MMPRVLKEEGGVLDGDHERRTDVQVAWISQQQGDVRVRQTRLKGEWGKKKKGGGQRAVMSPSQLNDVEYEINTFDERTVKVSRGGITGK